MDKVSFENITSCHKFKLIAIVGISSVFKIPFCDPVYE